VAVSIVNFPSAGIPVVSTTTLIEEGIVLSVVTVYVLSFGALDILTVVGVRLTVSFANLIVISPVDGKPVTGISDGIFVIVIVLLSSANDTVEGDNLAVILPSAAYPVKLTVAFDN